MIIWNRDHFLYQIRNCISIFDNNLVDNDSNKVVINRDGFVDKSFVNVEFDSEGAIKEIKKNDQNEFEVSLLMPSFDLAVPSTDFFIEYNYNDDLVKAFREINKTNYGIKEFEGENTVPFEADITEIKFRLGESDE